MWDDRAIPFRGCEATAPLKQLADWDDIDDDSAFRGCEATAPLKRLAVPRRLDRRSPSVAAKPRPH